ncbi:nuclear transport factor 2 family protein [Streptomyces pinistramenti]|uniref:nuclear transport factor 2 family protein n=1 Tax=Streptomyces pinistramenti TaxID=2884812 RepID=UPI001D0744CB|nr:nuclear transport factor 2 family protein [Streptomyces pinistramenti]MCB5910200.1 nuclear transport factor 2 family protein [Streptomyces pinistramenti]
MTRAPRPADPSGTSLPPPVQRALYRANGGDTDGFADCFAHDGAVNDWGREFRGREEIRGWSDAEFTGKQVTLEVTGASTEGATTTVSTQVGGNGFHGPSVFAFTVDGDRIRLMRITG